MTESTGIVHRPLRGAIYGLTLGIGLALLLISFSVITIGITVPVIVIVLCTALGITWSRFAPPKSATA